MALGCFWIGFFSLAIVVVLTVFLPDRINSMIREVSRIYRSKEEIERLKAR